uniref:Uncharacterized protein n=1 Tax=Denticeps clupeoides TaxID=299321 RepID=A0AAY4EGE1_9TELE
MGNLISRPSCLGHKSKHVRTDEDYLKECYQRKREWPPREPREEKKKEDEEPCPTPEKPRSSPAPTVTTTSTLDNAWRNTPSPIKTPHNGSLPRMTNATEFRHSPLGHCDKGGVERRSSLQRRDSGSPWSWKTLSSREVTEVTEVTETIVTEIVEVTEYPSGGKGGDPIVTRTVRVLTGAAEELAELQSDGHSSSDQDLSLDRWKGARSALTLKDEFGDPETFHQNLEALLTWVGEIEELTANQKPPSSEFKVVKAQLQEQKLLQRLLEDRKLSMETMMLEGPHLSEALEEGEKEQTRLKLSTLKRKWQALQLVAEKRRASLELVLPRAQLFQRSMDSLQQWLISVEQDLAELRTAERGMLHLQEATEQAKAVMDQIKGKNADLGTLQINGRDLMEKVSGIFISFITSHSKCVCGCFIDVSME